MSKNINNNFTKRIEQVTMLVSINKDAYPDETLDLIMEVAMKHSEIINKLNVIECTVEPLELSGIQYKNLKKVAE
tara:strand:- start:3020 stop:3244 length:225 start_codon:yes stop_codon:yes gene_type:complete